MVESEELDSNSAPKNGENNEFKFKCCAKKCTVMIRLNCHSVFHNSCSERSANKFKIIGNGKVMCCEINNEVNKTSIKSELQKAKLEIEYLKKLVEEMTNKNTILKENNFNSNYFS